MAVHRTHNARDRYVISVGESFVSLRNLRSTSNACIVVSLPLRLI